jgi:hypothetical protein
MNNIRLNKILVILYISLNTYLMIFVYIMYDKTINEKIIDFL